MEAKSLHDKLCSALWFAYLDGHGWPNGLPSWEEVQDFGDGLEPASYGWWRITINEMADWAIKVFEADKAAGRMADEQMAKFIEQLRKRAGILSASSAWGFDGDGHMMLKAADHLEELTKGRSHVESGA